MKITKNKSLSVFLDMNSAEDKKPSENLQKNPT